MKALEGDALGTGEGLIVRTVEGPLEETELGVSVGLA